MIDALFEASIADVLDEFVSDQRLKDALFGQGVIGTFAGPNDPGTASVKLMHFQGDLLGEGPIWGYVKGGMGMISFAIAEAAQDAGAVLAAGVPVGEIVPGEGVRLEDGTFLAAPHGRQQRRPEARPRPGRRRCDAGRLPGTARGVGHPQPGREVQRGAEPAAVLDGRARARRSWRAGRWTSPPASPTRRRRSSAARAGEPAVGFGEIYVQTLHDPSPAPPGKHLMSVFGQYAPYDLNGGWDARRDEVARQFIDLIGAVRAGLRGLPRALRGARRPRHRGARRADRRAHLPGRGASRPDVGAPAHAAHAGVRRCTSAAPPPTPQAA